MFISFSEIIIFKKTFSVSLYRSIDQSIILWLYVCTQTINIIDDLKDDE